jgi:Trypsin-like peptidase domain
VGPRKAPERVLLMVLATLALWCGSLPASWAAQPSRAESALEGVLAVVGRHAAGHACPVEPRLALTSAHVVDLRPFDPSIPLYPYVWSDGSGASGFLVPDGRVEAARDLARVFPLPGETFPHPLPVASEAPKPGDRVWLLGYDWSSRKNAMAPKTVEARVTRIVAGHLFFMPSGQEGSSGSCVVNELGQVVAINSGSFETEDHEEIGRAVGVWGWLSKVPQLRGEDSE